MLRMKKTPFIVVMMPHLIVIEDGKIINNGYISYDYLHTECDITSIN